MRFQSSAPCTKIRQPLLHRSSRSRSRAYTAVRPVSCPDGLRPHVAQISPPTSSDICSTERHAAAAVKDQAEAESQVHAYGYELQDSRELRSLQCQLIHINCDLCVPYLAASYALQAIPRLYHLQLLHLGIDWNLKQQSKPLPHRGLEAYRSNSVLRLPVPGALARKIHKTLHIAISIVVCYKWAVY